MTDRVHRTIDQGVERLTRALKAFDPNQPRADDGKWTSSGSAHHDTDSHDADDRAFVKKYGKEFVPAVNYLFDEYGISGNALLDLQAEVNAKTPDELVNFVKDNYQGEYNDDGEIAKDWLSTHDLEIPEIVEKHIDFDSLGFDLTEKDGPLMRIIDTNADGEHVFTRPKKG